MITIRQSTEAGLEIVERPVKGCWIDVIDPTSDEVSSLAQDFGILQEFITASLKRSEISRIDKENDALLILARIPHFQSTTASVPFITLTLGIIVTQEWVVTLCQHEHNLLHDLPHEYQIDLSTAEPARFVLYLLWSIAHNYILHLNKIEKIVEKLEDRLQRALENREVLELLRYQKCLVHFTTALQANKTMLERLHKSEALEMERKDADLLDEVFTECHQAIAMSEIARDILSQMMDAFASIISNNLNRVMKFMASIAVILVVPTIIASFYGMNVGLPLNDHPSAFLILVGMSLLGSFMIALIFWRKDWL
jgi:magnesium transporter